jgi:hypothetical protein
VELYNIHHRWNSPNLRHLIDQTEGIHVRNRGQAYDDPATATRTERPLPEVQHHWLSPSSVPGAVVRDVRQTDGGSASSEDFVASACCDYV